MARLDRRYRKARDYVRHTRTNLIKLARSGHVEAANLLAAADAIEASDTPDNRRAMVRAHEAYVPTHTWA